MSFLFFPNDIENEYAIFIYVRMQKVPQIMIGYAKN